MIIHKQDVNLLEDVLQILRDYSLMDGFEENYNDYELEWIKESISKLDMLKERAKQEFLNT
jgi:hypothetical protein